MNIVIVSPLLPFPLSSGGAQAQFNMIDRMRHNHNITFVFPQNGYNSLKAMRELTVLWPEVKLVCYSYAAQMLNPTFVWQKAMRAFNLRFRADSPAFQQSRVLDPYGFSLDARFGDFLRKHIRLAKADVVEVDFYQFLDVVDLLPKDIPAVFVHHEIRFIRNERLLADFPQTPELQHRKEMVRRHEIAQLNKFQYILTLTATDARLLRENGCQSPVGVSPAAVNAEVMPYKAWNGTVCFLGGYAHFPNQEGVDWFLNKVCPLLDPAVKESLQFNIVGGGWPGSYEKACGIRSHRLGFVDKLSDALHGAILVVPILSGSGMRMKILEAAAMSVPMLTTTVGVEGLDFQNGHSCLVADTPEAFAQALQRLISDEALRRDLSSEAQKIFRQQYSVEALTKCRQAFFEELLSKIKKENHVRSHT